MKKKLLLLLSLIPTLYLSGQEVTTNKQGQNEIKINTISLIAMGAIDISYERILNEESSFGISAYIKSNDDFNESDISRTFSLTPYYRVHFSKGYNKGFFIEGFAVYYKGEEFIYENYNYDYNYSSNYTIQDYDGLALGVGIGGKWVTKRGFVAEISLGIGRNISGGPQDVPVVGRGGITLGKRF